MRPRCPNCGKRRKHWSVTGNGTVTIDGIEMQAPICSDCFNNPRGTSKEDS